MKRRRRFWQQLASIWKKREPITFTGNYCTVYSTFYNCTNFQRWECVPAFPSRVPAFQNFALTYIHVYTKFYLQILKFAFPLSILTNCFALFRIPSRKILVCVYIFLCMLQIFLKRLYSTVC